MQVEENISLMFSYNVIINEKKKKTFIAIVFPKIAMSMMDNNKLKDIAEQIEDKLKRAIDNVNGVVRTKKKYVYSMFYNILEYPIEPCFSLK